MGAWPQAAAGLPAFQAFCGDGQGDSCLWVSFLLQAGQPVLNLSHAQAQGAFGKGLLQAGGALAQIFALSLFPFLKLPQREIRLITGDYDHAGEASRGGCMVGAPSLLLLVPSLLLGR